MSLITAKCIQTPLWYPAKVESMAHPTVERDRADVYLLSFLSILLDSLILQVDFHDDKGQAVKEGDFLGNRPCILLLVTVEKNVLLMSIYFIYPYLLTLMTYLVWLL